MISVLSMILTSCGKKNTSASKSDEGSYQKIAHFNFFPENYDKE